MGSKENMPPPVINDRPSLLEYLKAEDALNDFKMRLPRELEIIPARYDVSAYIKARESVGFELLPLFDQDLNMERRHEKFSLAVNEILAIRWEDYRYRYTVSGTPPAMPEAKDVRFERQKVVCPDQKVVCPGQKVVCPSCANGTCGKRMVEGPKVDETGQLPIPANVLHRYREKLASIKAKRARNPFK